MRFPTEPLEFLNGEKSEFPRIAVFGHSPSRGFGRSIMFPLLPDSSSTSLRSVAVTMKPFYILVLVAALASIPAGKAAAVA